MTEFVSKNEDGLGWLNVVSTSSGRVLWDVGLEHSKDELMVRTCGKLAPGG